MGCGGAAQPGSWRPGRQAGSQDAAGSTPGPLALAGELGWTRRNQNCCVIAAAAAVARATGVSHAPPVRDSCRAGPRCGASPSPALGSRDQRPHPAPEARAFAPLGWAQLSSGLAVTRPKCPSVGWGSPQHLLHRRVMVLTLCCQRGRPVMGGGPHLGGRGPGSHQGASLEAWGGSWESPPARLSQRGARHPTGA